MRKIFLTANLLLVFAMLTPGSTVGFQKKKDQKKNTPAKEEATLQDYSSLAQVKEINGKLADFNLESGTMTFTIEWYHMEPNPNAKLATAKGNQKAFQQQQQLLREYNTIMTTKNPVHLQQALMRYQQKLQQLQTTSTVNLLNMFRIVKSSKDFEVSFVDKLKVVRVKLEQKYNDEGELVKYTADELKKMKSTDISGAYKATPEELKTGQAVTLYLSPPKKQDNKKSDKESKKSDSAGDAKDKVIIDGETKQTGDAKDKQATDLKEPLALSAALADRPQVRMVLILEEASPGIPDELPKGKKK
jgi:hypothetical protein